MNTLQLDRQGLEQIIKLLFAKYKPSQIKSLTLQGISAQAISLQLDSSLAMLGSLGIELLPQPGSALIFDIDIKAGMRTPLIKGLLKSFLPFQPNEWLVVSKELQLQLDMPKLLQSYNISLEFKQLQLQDNGLLLELQ